MGVMRSRPVQATATSTTVKVRRGLEYVRRHPLAHVGARHRFEAPVAAEAAPEEIPALERERRPNLPQLLAEIVAGEEEMGWQLGIADEARVARQEDPALAASAHHQRAPTQVRAVGHVVTEDA